MRAVKEDIKEKEEKLKTVVEEWQKINVTGPQCTRHFCSQWKK